MTASHSSHSTTYSGISQGALTIRDPAAQHALTGHTAAQTIAGLNRDILTDTATSNALIPIFDEQRINAGFDIVTALQRETGTFINNRAAEADLKTRQATAADQAAHDPSNGLNDQQRQTLRDQAITLTNEAQAIKDAWGPGGTYRQITTALAAGASGNVSAASSDLAKHMIVNYVQQQGATAIGHWVATGQLTEGSPYTPSSMPCWPAPVLRPANKAAAVAPKARPPPASSRDYLATPAPKTPPKTAKPNATSLPPSSPASPAPLTPMPPPPPMPPSLPWITTG